MRDKKKIGLLFIVILGAVLMIILALKENLLQKISFAPTIRQSLTGKVDTIVAPFEFQELTIPYLRKRNYESELGELRKFNDYQNYTSYTTYYTSDGLQINALLTKPKGDMPEGGWPAVIFLHGYIPPSQYMTTQNYASYVDAIARNGLVVFKIDLRGHGKSEGEPGGAYYSSDYVIDTLSAYSALQKSGFVKRDGIGLWGHSMAGNVTFRSFVVNKKIAALVIWAGAGYTYEDIQEYGIDDDSYRPPSIDSNRQRKRKELFDKYGEFSAQSRFWKQVIPTNYLDGVEGAVQLHHAVDDSVVSIEYSRNLVRLLGDTSVSHELFEYQSGGHNLTGPNFNRAMQRSVQFFIEKLHN